MSVANLCLLLMNEPNSSNINMVDIFSYLISKMKVKQERPVFELYSVFSNMSDFAESNNNFQIIKDYFFNLMLFMI